MKKSPLERLKPTVGKVLFLTITPTKIYSFIPLRLSHSKPMDTVCTIWQEMSGNGVWIGTTTTITKPWKEKQRPILKGLRTVTTPTILISLKGSSAGDLFCATTPIALAIGWLQK